MYAFAVHSSQLLCAKHWLYPAVPCRQEMAILALSSNMGICAAIMQLFMSRYTLKGINIIHHGSALPSHTDQASKGSLIIISQYRIFCLEMNAALMQSTAQALIAGLGYDQGGAHTACHRAVSQRVCKFRGSGEILTGSAIAS